MYGGIIKQFRIIISYKPCTTCTWGYYIVRSAKVFYKFYTYRSCLIPKPGVKGRLSATGLFCIVGNSAAYFLKHFNHIKSCLRIKLVNKTRYEKLYVHKPPVPLKGRLRLILV